MAPAVIGSNPIAHPNAQLAKLVDAPASRPGVERRVGSSPALGTRASARYASYDECLAASVIGRGLAQLVEHRVLIPRVEGSSPSPLASRSVSAWRNW